MQRFDTTRGRRGGTWMRLRYARVRTNTRAADTPLCRRFLSSVGFGRRGSRLPLRHACSRARSRCRHAPLDAGRVNRVRACAYVCPPVARACAIRAVCLCEAWVRGTHACVEPQVAAYCRPCHRRRRARHPVSDYAQGGFCMPSQVVSSRLHVVCRRRVAASQSCSSVCPRALLHSSRRHSR